MKNDEMKGLFICCGQKPNESSGIYKKIRSQVAFLNTWPLNTELVMIDNQLNVFNKIIYLFPHIMSSYEKRILSLTKKYNFSKIDFIYFRWVTPSYGLLRFFKEVKKVNSRIKIIVELPTYPGGGEYKGFKKFIMKWWPKPILNELHLYIDRIVTFSKDESIWNIQTIKLHNCVDFDSISLRTPVLDKPCNTIKLLSVASNDFWHGYDRVLEGINNYLTNHLDSKKYCFEYHLVGGGSMLETYRKYIQEHNLENAVFVHGPIQFDDLSSFYDSCDIGIDSLGRHRSGVFYNSSLKAKEYIAKGLPYITSVDSEVDDDHFDYCLKISPDDTPVDFEEVVRFYEKVYSFGSKKEVASKIRDFGVNRYDYKIGYIPLFKYITGDKSNA